MSLDVRAGTVEPVEVGGDPPPAEVVYSAPRTPFADGVVLVHAISRDREDDDDARLWRLAATDAGACWSSTRTGLARITFDGSTGVAADASTSYFVGPTLLRVR